MVFELVAGIVIGPSVLGWAEIDQTIEVLSVVGLAFLLFLAGLEIDFQRLGGRPVRLAAAGFGVSLAIAVPVGFGLDGLGLIETPLLVAIILSATSLGVIIPVLKDAGELDKPFGQLLLAAASIADFAAVILLSFFFSGAGGPGSTAVLLGVFAALLVIVLVAVRGAERSRRISENLLRLQDTSAQIRIRGAVLFLIAFVAVAQRLGLEIILGAFAAGALLTLLDTDQQMTHPQFRRKLEAMGFGFFVPVFFVASGIEFDVGALFATSSAAVMVPIFLVALLGVRGLPALVYRRLIGARRVPVAALLQATSLPFVVAATAIGMELGLMEPAEGAALIAAGLLSVLIFPVSALGLLRRTVAADAQRSCFPEVKSSAEH